MRFSLASSVIVCLTLRERMSTMMTWPGDVLVPKYPTLNSGSDTDVDTLASLSTSSRMNDWPCTSSEPGVSQLVPVQPSEQSQLPGKVQSPLPKQSLTQMAVSQAWPL